MGKTHNSCVCFKDTFEKPFMDKTVWHTHRAGLRVHPAIICYYQEKLGKPEPCPEELNIFLLKKKTLEKRNRKGVPASAIN